MVPLEEIFCFIDDFCKQFEEKSSIKLLPNSKRQWRRSCRLNLSKIMTILVLFQLSYYRTFKDFYKSCLSQHYKDAFPTLVSYNRFLELIPFAIMPLLLLLVQIPGKKTGRYFIDSTKLPVCDNWRIGRHKVFEGFAKRGKTSTRWFFGFKLHLVINDKGELIHFKITLGNTDDRSVVQVLTQGLKGWLFGNKGYLSKKLAQTLKASNIELITRLKRNMKKQFLDPIRKWWLNKRGVIESVIDQLKAILHLQHTRHCSVQNYFANILSALLVYSLKPKKPSITFEKSITKMMPLISS